MLAYVFWHWRYPYIDKASYEERLINFHRALRAQNTPGFQFSLVFQIESAPWTGGDMEAYEDWYLMDNSAVLDLLNETAVSGPCKEPHRQIASYAVDGAGGLYRLHSGIPNLASARIAHWFSKPSGMSYETLYASLLPEIQQVGGSLWQRQMTLGPAPEFCKYGSEDSMLPEPFESLNIPVSLIWSGS